MNKHEKNAIKLLGTITPKKAPLAILQKVLLRESTATANSLEERMSIHSPMFRTPEPYLLDLKTFAKCGSIAACSTVSNIDDFPLSNYNAAPDRMAWGFDSPADTIRMIDQCAPYASIDESRNVLCSVYIDATRSSVVASDGHRLFCIEDPAIGKGKEDIMIPGTVARRLSQIALLFDVMYLGIKWRRYENPGYNPECKDSVQYHYKSFIACDFEGPEIKGRYFALLHDANDVYPPWPKVVPDFNDENRTIVALSPEHLRDLIAAVESLQPFTNPKTHLIRLQGPDTLAVYNSGIDECIRYAQLSFSFLPAMRTVMIENEDFTKTVRQVPWEIGLNADYWIELLKEFVNEKEFAFSWDTNPLTAKLMRSGNRTGLIMPLKILDGVVEDENTPPKTRIRIGGGDDWADLI